MAPLAIIAKEAGFQVSGCDVADSFITDTPLRTAGIHPLVGFHPLHLKGVDLVITTGAHNGKNNPEVLQADRLHIPIRMQGQAVGEFMKGDLFHRKLKGISVAGCHGKTTTTALVATLLKNGQYDPSFVIGTGEIPSLGGSGHYGHGDYFIAEADEYATDPQGDRTPKFLWHHPEIAIITNIEFDHPDLYKNIEQTENAYAQFVKNIHSNGVLIANGDDEHVRKILKNVSCRTTLFGFNSNNDYVLQNIRIRDRKTFFTLSDKKGFDQEFAVNVIGTHNAFNATAALFVAKEVGMSDSDIQSGLFSFHGTKRRFEYKGKLVSGALLYDDYAHHPTEIQATLAALHAAHPSSNIVAIFQPHTFSRTKIMFDDFINSFSDARIVLLTQIYASKREAPDGSISSEMLVAALQKAGKKVVFVPQLNDVVEYVHKQHWDESYCLITLGAGDIYKIEDQLTKEELL